MMTVQHIEAIRDQIKNEMSSSSTNFNKVNQLLTQAKLVLIELGAYVPVPGKTDKNTLTTARDILEYGAYYSVRNKDIPSFERYISQLNTYYHDLNNVLPPSNQMYPLIGLNLLRLLSQNRLSDFHTVLESIDLNQLQTNLHIKQAVDLEQFLMEGSYNKVWSTRSSIRGEEFLFFYDILMDTIRHEIASCSEKAYDYLPLHGACTLLFLNNTEELLNFTNERGWRVNPSEQRIYFNAEDTNILEIPQEQIISRTLGYARELERIV